LNLQYGILVSKFAYKFPLVPLHVALNAALLMCCASWCCRGFSFGRSDEEEGDFTVDSVAATTPLLVEYEAGLYKLSSADPQLESAWFQPLSLSSDKLVSNFA
jgi:hypothetical protein